MTIYDIAKEAGVSITTVSRVINKKSGIKESTRQKVQEVLDKHHYLPSPSAKGLAQNSTYNIAVITEDIRNIHYANTVFTIEQELKKYGYYCTLMNTGINHNERILCLESVMNLRVDGAILVGSTFEEKYIQRAITRYLPNTPIVIANGYLDLSNVCGILCDGKQGIEMAVEHLVGLGHTNIGYIGYNQNASSRNKHQGYVDAMNRNKLNLYEKFPKAESEIRAGNNATTTLLKENDNITAIIYENDNYVIGGMQSLENKGYEIPKDIAVVGFDNSILAQNWIPPITSVDDKLGIMGTKCVQALFEMMEKGATVSQMVLIPELIIRKSTIG